MSNLFMTLDGKVDLGALQAFIREEVERRTSEVAAKAEQQGKEAVKSWVGKWVAVIGIGSVIGFYGVFTTTQEAVEKRAIAAVEEAIAKDKVVKVLDEAIGNKAVSVIESSAELTNLQLETKALSRKSQIALSQAKDALEETSNEVAALRELRDQITKDETLQNVRELVRVASDPANKDSVDKLAMVGRHEDQLQEHHRLITHPSLLALTKGFLRDSSGGQVAFSTDRKSIASGGRKHTVNMLRFHGGISADQHSIFGSHVFVHDKVHGKFSFESNEKDMPTP